MNLFKTTTSFDGIPLSFSASPYLEFPPAGFSFQWYARYFAGARWMSATALSAEIAVGTTAFALSLGIPAAFGLVRRQFRGKGALVAFFMSPIIVPYIITAIAVYFLFARLGLIGSRLGLLIAHTLLAVPKVVVIVAAALKGFDRTLERASMSLGAGPWVCEIERAIGAVDQIIGAVEPFSLIAIGQYRDRTIPFETRDPAIAVFIDRQAPLAVHRESVGTRLTVLGDVGAGIAARRSKNRELPIGDVLVDRVGVRIAK